MDLFESEKIKTVQTQKKMSIVYMTTFPFEKTSEVSSALI